MEEGVKLNDVKIPVLRFLLDPRVVFACYDRTQYRTEVLQSEGSDAGVDREVENVSQLGETDRVC